MKYELPFFMWLVWIKLIVAFVLFFTYTLVGVYQTDSLNYVSDNNYLNKTSTELDKTLGLLSQDANATSSIFSQMTSSISVISQIFNVAVLSFSTFLKTILSLLLGDSLYNYLANSLIFNTLMLLIKIIDFVITGVLFIIVLRAVLQRAL